MKSQLFLFIFIVSFFSSLGYSVNAPEKGELKSHGFCLSGTGGSDLGLVEDFDTEGLDFQIDIADLLDGFEKGVKPEVASTSSHGGASKDSGPTKGEDLANRYYNANQEFFQSVPDIDRVFEYVIDFEELEIFYEDNFDGLVICENDFHKRMKEIISAVTKKSALELNRVKVEARGKLAYYKIIKPLKKEKGAQVSLEEQLEDLKDYPKVIDPKKLKKKERKKKKKEAAKLKKRQRHQAARVLQQWAFSLRCKKKEALKQRRLEERQAEELVSEKSASTVALAVDMELLEAKKREEEKLRLNYEAILSLPYLEAASARAGTVSDINLDEELLMFFQKILEPWSQLEKNENLNFIIDGGYLLRFYGKIVERSFDHQTSDLDLLVTFKNPDHAEKIESVRARLAKHLYIASKGSSTKIARAIRKYGASQLKMKVLFTTKNKEEISQSEYLDFCDKNNEGVTNLHYPEIERIDYSEYSNEKFFRIYSNVCMDALCRHVFIFIRDI